jgi:hypothetical protein
MSLYAFGLLRSPPSPPCARARRAAAQVPLPGCPPLPLPAVMAARLRHWYMAQLAARPWTTNMISGGAIMAVGDATAQLVEQQQQPGPAHGHNSGIDPVRSAVMVGWASLGDTPITAILIGRVERGMRMFNVPAQASLPLSLLKCICFWVPGTLTRNPIFFGYFTAADHSARNLVAGRSASDGLAELWAPTVASRLQNDLLPVMMASAVGWIPCNTLMFWLCPPPLRVVWAAGASAVWSVYLSLAAHNPHTE